MSSVLTINNKTELTFKRVIDIVVSALGLLFLFPILLLIGLAVRLTSPGPAIFRQQRLGKGGVAYTMYKFRTMYQDAWKTERRDSQGATIIPKDDPRITRIGWALRYFSLDELPQLWNILRNDMSLVGPRPDQAKDIVLYNELDKIKLRMKPGLTGLAMINGRNSIRWRKRMEWDIKYVEEFSLKLDFIILLRTLKVVLRREGVFTEDTVSVDNIEHRRNLSGD